MSAEKNPVVDILNAYKAAVHAKDLQAFAALYAPDIHVFDMWGPWSLSGVAAWVQETEGWFTSLGSEHVVVGIDDVVCFQADGLACGHATLTYTAVSAEGQALRSLQNRISLVLNRTDTGWQIVHQHTSAPVDFSTMKPQLRRQPA